jgi:hypothetical protein
MIQCIINDTKIGDILNKMKDAFNKCIHRVKKRDDRYEIKCKLHLWSVEGHYDNLQQIEDEAFWYWLQYSEDGEYSEIIGGLNVLEVLESKERSK